MKYFEIQSIDDVRKWLEEHPNHIITSAWKDMLFDMDNHGEKYTLEDFQEEAQYQMFDHGGELGIDEVKE